MLGINNNNGRTVKYLISSGPMFSEPRSVANNCMARGIKLRASPTYAWIKTNVKVRDVRTNKKYRINPCSKNKESAFIAS